MTSNPRSQFNLFAPKITVLDAPPEETDAQNLDDAEYSYRSEDNLIISREDLITRLLTSYTNFRRWERQRVLGATDEELAHSIGQGFFSDHTIQTTFQTEKEPAVRCIAAETGDELFTLTAPQLATRIRLLTNIPQKPSPEETARLLKEVLDRQRTSARQDIFRSAQSLLKDKARKKEDGFTSSIVDLLFQEDCLTEAGERRTLETITALLIKREWKTAEAMETALNLVKRARSTWQSIEGYWLDNYHWQK